MTKTVIFIGYIWPKYLEYFYEKGYTIGLFLDKERPTFASGSITNIYEKLDFIYPINFESAKSVADSLHNVYLKPNTLLICLNDRYLLATAKIAQTLNLTQQQSLPIELAQNATNKLFQRKVFQQIDPSISPEFKKIRTFHGAYTFARKYGFPVIIKPANLSQSQLVNICDNLEELISKVSYVLDHVAEVYKENQVHRKPLVIIERYIQGRQFSVDSYVSMDGTITHTPVCRQIVGQDVGLDNFETLYSTYPSGLSAQQENLVYQVVSKAIQSLHIVGNPTHTEVKITPEGECKVVEINIRTGGFRAEMLKHSYDIDHVDNVIANYLREKVVFDSSLKAHSACPQFWSPVEGILESIEGVEELQSLPSFKNYGIAFKPGEEVGPADKGHPRILHAILSHEDKKVLEQDLDTIRRIIQFKVKQNAPEEEI